MMISATARPPSIPGDGAHSRADASSAAGGSTWGLELMRTTPRFAEGAAAAIRDGLLDESMIDTAVRRILALKFRMGLFEDPRLPDPERVSTVIGSEEHRLTNRDLARESVVLLTNDGVLPLGATPPAQRTGVTAAPDSHGLRSIAVVGPLADAAQAQLGDWAGSSGQVPWMSDGQPRSMITTVLA